LIVLPPSFFSREIWTFRVFFFFFSSPSEVFTPLFPSVRHRWVFFFFPLLLISSGENRWIYSNSLFFLFLFVFLLDFWRISLHLFFLFLLERCESRSSPPDLKCLPLFPAMGRRDFLPFQIELLFFFFRWLSRD